MQVSGAWVPEILLTYRDFKLLRFAQLILFGTKRPSRLARKRRPALRKPRTVICDPALTLMWLELANTYFPDRTDLSNYKVRWSTRRQKRVLGSCNMTKRIVSVARELNTPEHHHWLEPLLYHEMCHAVLERSVSKRGRKILWHGPEFKALEARHPGIPALDFWIKSGGWRSAVLSARAKSSWEVRRAVIKSTSMMEVK